MHALSLVDAAYIAGLIHEEGTVTLTRLHRDERRRLVVSISNNDRSLLEFVRETVGAGKITGKRKYSENHAASFTWQLTSRQALALLEQVGPILWTYKAKRAALLLEHYVALTPRIGKYGVKTAQERIAFETAFLSIRSVS